MADEKPLWQRTLEILSTRFDRAAEQNSISTLVVYAEDTTSGRRRLDGPRKHHWIWEGAEMGRPIMPTAKFKVLPGPATPGQAEPFPCRSIYFGGQPDSKKLFRRLSEEAGWLLNQDQVMNLVPPECRTAPSWLGGDPYPDIFIHWILAVHHFGQQRYDAAPLHFDRRFWSGDTCYDFEPNGRWPKGKAPKFYFTYSHNTFADSAAAIQMLFASPPSDWFTVAETKLAIDRDPDHVKRLINTGKIESRGEGTACRVSPHSIVSYLIKRNKEDQLASLRADAAIISRGSKSVQQGKPGRKSL